MAKLRRNYDSKGKGLQTTFRLIVLLIFVIIGMVAAFYYYKSSLEDVFTKPDNEAEEVRTYLPNAKGEMVNHKYYTLSYVESDEQAEWVAYKMTREMLNIPNVPRFDYYNEDKDVKTGSAVHSDYTNSGYTRGHLAPAGDMAFDEIAMKESFFMSNMSPQLREFNNGVWKELEESIRDWTYKAGLLYIVTGPILEPNNLEKIGRNKVSVPKAFYKIILDYSDNSKKAIGFIIPNSVSELTLDNYMVTVDDVEKITGIDFFNEMINDVEEEKIESTIDKSLWKLSDKRYKLRISRWNKE